MRRNLLPGLLLIAITLAGFWPVGRLGFIGYDDFDYVYQNPTVLSGLNWDSIVWAFTSPHSSNWHPLTWLSHMLDCQWFGLNPGEEHWVNLGFHTANTLLLFLLLWQFTGARWRSFLVAALFALHPLHVQSVAWISERKDVLSGFFALLTLIAYGQWARGKSGTRERGKAETDTDKSLSPPNPGPRTHGPEPRFYYWTVIVLFALGLMAKPMLVTLPLVMLLLDYWPLGRLSARRPPTSPGAPAPRPPLAFGLKTFRLRWQPLVLEKKPLFALSLASCLITIWAQWAGGSMVTLEKLAWPERCLHAVVSYSLYLGKLFWPVNLAIFYPFTHTTPGATVGLFLVPVLLTALCLWHTRTRPWLLVGWGWFVITLIPVIGIMQVGLQSIADRYTYLPSIGLFIAVVWGLTEMAGKSKLFRVSLAAAGAAVLLGCGLDTRYQLGFWQDNIKLFKHVLAVTPENNSMGHFYLGVSYADLHDLDAAASSFAAALAADPNFSMARTRLGNVFLLQKKYPAAETQFRQVLKRHPENASVHVTLGFALAGQQRDAEAQTEYLTARQLSPGDEKIQGILAANTQRLAAEQALTNLTRQLLTHRTPEIHAKIAATQSSLGHYREARDHYQQALGLGPDSPAALNNLAWLLATCPDPIIRDGRRAVALAQRACELTQFKTTVFVGTLAAAYAEAGQFDQAIATAQKACDLAAAHGETDLLQRNQELLATYQRHQAWHEGEK
jgi:tetratricopeptide (TPR) repeat protein